MPSKQGSRLFWRISNTQHPKGDLQQTLADHPLNHALQILLPVSHGTDAAAKAALEAELSILFPALDNDSQFQVLQDNLGDVVEHILTSGLLTQPQVSLQAVSLTERLDTAHSGLAITPDGSLHLALDRQSYQRLGLVGTGSRADADRYNVTVDLKREGVQPGGRRHKELVDKLRAGTGRQALLLRLERSGRREDFGLPRDATAAAVPTRMALEAQASRLEGLMLPPHLPRGLFEPQRDATAAAAATARRQMQQQGGAPRSAAAGAQQQHDAMDVDGAGEGRQQQQQQPQEQYYTSPQALIQDMHVWLSALMCGLDPSACNALLPAACTADAQQQQQEQVGDDHAAGASALVGRTWRGLLSHQQVASGLRLAGQLVGAGRCGWALLSVWGFADSPVGWQGEGRGAEHGAERGLGAAPLESQYSVLLLSNQDYCLFRPMGSGEWQAGA